MAIRIWKFDEIVEPSDLRAETTWKIYFERILSTTTETICLLNVGNETAAILCERENKMQKAQ